MAIVDDTTPQNWHKTSFDGIGKGLAIKARDPIVFADFTTGTGVGTVLLELEVDSADVWLPITAALTADTPALRIPTARLDNIRAACSLFTSGIIAVYFSGRDGLDR